MSNPSGIPLAGSVSKLGPKDLLCIRHGWPPWPRDGGLAAVGYEYVLPNSNQKSICIVCSLAPSAPPRAMGNGQWAMKPH